MCYQTDLEYQCWAVATGASAAAIEVARDGDDPKADIIELLAH